jgi:raffinose/stachyose/melibiose transport system substrate-binding protein
VQTRSPSSFTGLRATLALAASAAILFGACSSAATSAPAASQAAAPAASQATAASQAAGGAASAAASAAPNLSGTISFLEKWPEPQYAPYFQTLVKNYEALHPQVHIKLQAVADQPIKDELRVLTAAGQLPDIFFSWAGDFTAKYVRAGLVADLTAPVMNTDWKNVYAGGALAAATYDGKLYGIPIDLDAKFMAYNKSIFAAHNWTVPTSMSGLLSLCDTIKATGLTPISFGNVNGWPAIHYMTQLNAYYVPPATLQRDYTPATGAFTDPGYLQALQTFQSIDQHCLTPDANAITHDQAVTEFVQGKAAMMYVEQADFPSFTVAQGAPASFANAWDFFQLPFPTGAAGSPTTLEGAPDLFLVNAKTQHMDIVLNFLRYFSDMQNAQQMVKQLNWLSPVLGSATADNTFPQNIKALEAINNASNMAIWLDTVTNINVATAYLNGAEALIGGTETAQQVLKNVQAGAAKAKINP